MPTRRPSRRMFGEPGLPPPRAGLAALDAARAVRRRGAGHRSRDAAAGAGLGAATCKCGRSRRCPTQDWVRLTQSQFAPVEITPTFWIVPSWHERAGRRAQVIRLDPGLAFGTGTHPTTRMCLRWIARTRRSALAARARLRLRLRHPGHRRGAARRATRVDAVDIDPAAVEATHANAAANGVALQPRPARGGARALRRWCWPTSWPRR